jgi:hypothetical protein
MEPGHNGNVCLAENFYSPEDPKGKYLYENEHTCNGKKFLSLAVPLQAACTVLYIFSFS